MKTTICPYFVASSGVHNGKPDFWGAVSLKNISSSPATATLTVTDFVTGATLKTIPINLSAGGGILLTNTGELSGLENKRLTLELTGSDSIWMTPLNARRDSGIGPLETFEIKK